jgi:ABC-2 type transport system permease protein
MSNAVARIDSAPRRVGAVLLRHVYLARGSWTRVFDLIYWPVLQMVIWGFINLFMAQHSNWVVRSAGLLIGAVMLWDVLVRSQFGMTISLLEEMWSRNLANLFVSPLRPIEFACSLMALAVARSAIGVLPAALLAIPLFAYSIFTIGLPLVGFYAILVMFGWAVGLVIAAALFRFGLAAESYAWASIFVLAPITGVYYPIAVLPDWLQPVAWALAPTHVFEGMRALALDNTLRLDLMASGIALNFVYLALSVWVFLRAFERARAEGRLLHAGE